MYFQLLQAVDRRVISRKNACRILIKYGTKNEYIALLNAIPLWLVNQIIEKNDSFIDDYDGTEIKNIFD